MSCGANNELSAGKLFVAAWEGIRSGFLLVGSSIANLALHPLLSIQGVEHAVERWDNVIDILMSEWLHYRAAARLDSIVFVKSTLMILSALSLSVFVTQMLEKFGGRLSSFAQRRAVSSSGRVTMYLKKRGHRINSVLHQAVVLVRARNVLLARRLGVHATGIRKVKWRTQNLFNDGLQIVYLAIVKPLPCFVYCFIRLSKHSVLLLKSGLSATVRQLVLLVMPVAIVFQPWIDDAIRVQAVVSGGHQRIAPMVQRFSSDVEQLSLVDLKIRTMQLQSAFQEYRKQFLILIKEEDQIFETEVSVLDKHAREKTITDQVVDARLGAILDRFGHRRVYLSEEIFWYHKDAPHSPLTPSQNWLTSYQDELNLFLEVQQKAGAEEKAEFLQQVIARLENTIRYESCIAAWDLTELVKRPLPVNHTQCGSVDGSILQSPMQ